MLDSISLKFTETVPAAGVTIFVGPNNSGKSLALKEIEAEISSHSEIPLKIVSGYELDWSNEQKITDDLNNMAHNAPYETAVCTENSIRHRRRDRSEYPPHWKLDETSCVVPWRQWTPSQGWLTFQKGSPSNPRRAF
jgi:hypothetical protein